MQAHWFIEKTDRLAVCSVSPAGSGVLCLLLTAWALSGLGCGQVEAPRREPEDGAERAENLATDDSQPPASQANKIISQDNKIILETWDAVFLSGAKIGFSHTIYESVTRDGQQLVKASSWMQTEIVRYQQVAKTSLLVESLESESGEVLSLRAEIVAGPTPIIVQGENRDGELHLATLTQGKKMTRTIPWNASHGGFFAVEQSLAREPMQPGEERELTLLMPWLTGIEVVRSRLVAEALEPVALLGKTEQLLKIRHTTAIGKATIDSLCWTDPSGQILKNTIPPLQQTIIRTTKDIAQAKGVEGAYDLGQDSIVRIASPLPHPHQLTKAIYEISLLDADPAQVFALGASQIAEPLDPHTARLTVLAVRPGSPTTSARETPAGPRDREPNSLIQADDPEIQRMARQAVGQRLEEWEKCLELEKWVHGAIHSKNFGQGFATAADVARSLEGDCTEHAVLLAALCRAQSIPARVVVGLVYSPGDQGFAFHMWNEAWVADRWIGLDATLGQGGIGAAHLKISASDLGGDGADIALLSVMQVINQLKIAVLQYEPQ